MSCAGGGGVGCHEAWGVRCHVKGVGWLGFFNIACRQEILP